MAWYYCYDSPGIPPVVLGMGTASSGTLRLPPCRYQTIHHGLETVEQMSSRCKREMGFDTTHNTPAPRSKCYPPRRGRHARFRGAAATASEDAGGWDWWTLKCTVQVSMSTLRRLLPCYVDGSEASCCITFEWQPFHQSECYVSGSAVNNDK